MQFSISTFLQTRVKTRLQALANNGISIIIKSTDALLTVANIADLFDIPPQSVRILPQNVHELFLKSQNMPPKEAVLFVVMVPLLPSQS